MHTTICRSYLGRTFVTIQIDISRGQTGTDIPS